MFRIHPRSRVIQNKTCPLLRDRTRITQVAFFQPIPPKPSLRRHFRGNIASMSRKTIFGALAWLMAAISLRAADLKVGIIGLDTSHVTAFTQLLNDTGNKNHVAGAKVVAAFRGGSPDIESSRTRLDQYAKELQEKYDVRIVPSIEELCNNVDAVLLESVDGRPHLEQVRPVFKAGKPVFIDKPLAGSLKDALEIVRLARQTRTPCFSSSSYRFYESLIELKNA